MWAQRIFPSLVGIETGGGGNGEGRGGGVEGSISSDSVGGLTSSVPEPPAGDRSGEVGGDDINLIVQSH